MFGFWAWLECSSRSPPPFSGWSKMSLYYLFEACKRGDIARVRQAVADGVDVRKVVDKSWLNNTPLHYACGYVPHCM